MKNYMKSIRSNQARMIAPGTYKRTTKFKERGVDCMTRQEFEDALRIKQQILELKMVEEAGISIDKKRLKAMEKQLAGVKKRFNGMAKGLDCELANILELHYICGLPYRMVQKYKYGCNFCESHPRKIVERYFAGNS